MQSTLFRKAGGGLVNDYVSGYQVPLLEKQTSPYFPDFASAAIKPNRLRVASYCRVSTFTDMQEDSLENQIIHYTNFIRSNPQWQFAGIFSDRGKSGTKIANRTGFKKLIRHVLEGKIDLILCKSISRFARNVTDTLDMVRLLNDNGVNVIFEKENIDTGNMHSDFVLTMLSSFAQEESRNISENINWAVGKRFERGEPIFTRMLGYDRDENKKWIIIEEEARIVREAFEECIEGKKPSEIAKAFIKKGYRKVNGRTDWSSLAVRDILRNERYTGDAICQKTYTQDYLSHKRMPNDGKKSQYIVRNHHEAIIDKDTYDKAIALLNERSKKIGSRQRKTYPLSGRFVCSECGSNFQRYINRGIVTWRCGNRIKSKDLCNAGGIREDVVREILLQSFAERFQINESAQEKFMAVKMQKELQSAVFAREAEQNQLRLDLGRALIEENTAILKSNDEEIKETASRRRALEDRIAEREVWWNLIDEDDEYQKRALEVLDNIKSAAYPAKELKENMHSLEFLRAWVVRVRALSPILFSITWITGEDTEIGIGEEALNK